MKVSAALVGALLVTACAGTANDDGPRDASEIGGELSDQDIEVLGWGVPEPINSLDPAKNYTVSTQVAASLASETILTFDEDLQFTPQLASIDRPQPDKYVLDVNTDATFSNGDTLTAEDVAFSIARHLDPDFGSQQSFLLGSVEEVEAENDQVILNLSSPDPTIPYAMASLFVHSKAQAESLGDSFGSPDGVPVGTGMYTIDEYTPDGGVTATRRDDYWGTEPRAAKVDLRVIPSDDTLRLAAQQGDVAGSFEIAPSSLRRWESAEGLAATQAPGLNMIYFSVPTTTPPFDDIRVRKALSYAIDREGLVEAALAGVGEPAVSIASRGHWEGLVGPEAADEFLQSMPAYEFDMQAAEDELAASSSPEGFSADLFVASEDPRMERIALSVRENVESIGIDLNIRTVTQSQLIQDFAYGHRPALFLVGFLPSYPDPIDYLGQLLPSDQRADGVGSNSADYSNPEVDRLIQEQRVAEGEDRVALLEEAAQIAQEELPYIPVAWQNSTLGLSDDYRFNNFDGFSSLRSWPGFIGIPASE